MSEEFVYLLSPPEFLTTRSKSIFLALSFLSLHFLVFSSAQILLCYSLFTPQWPLPFYVYSWNTSMQLMEGGERPFLSTKRLPVPDPWTVCYVTPKPPANSIIMCSTRLCCHRMYHRNGLIFCWTKLNQLVNQRKRYLPTILVFETISIIFQAITSNNSRFLLLKCKDLLPFFVAFMTLSWHFIA